MKLLKSFLGLVYLFVLGMSILAPFTQNIPMTIAALVVVVVVNAYGDKIQTWLNS